jgi:N4-gp56 family major capsid protein
MFKGENSGLSAMLYWARVFLALLKTRQIYRIFAVKKTVPKNKGKTVKFRYHDPLPVATTPLVEGVTPTGSTPVLNTVTATLSPYGDYVDVSDEVGLFDEHGNVLVSAGSRENVELMTEQADSTLETLTKNTIKAGTNVFFSGAPSVTSRSGVGSANKVSLDDFRKIVRSLQTNKVKPIASSIAASQGIATQPVAASYIGLIGPNTLHDLSQIDGWVPVHKYANPNMAYPNEVGALADIGIRFLMTENDVVFEGEGSGSIDVYGTIVFGREFYGTISLENKKDVEFIAKAPGSAGTTDPLNQKATFGWKVSAFGTVILRQIAGYRYEHAVTS